MPMSMAVAGFDEAGFLLAMRVSSRRLCGDNNRPRPGREMQRSDSTD